MFGLFDSAAAFAGDARLLFLVYSLSMLAAMTILEKLVTWYLVAPKLPLMRRLLDTLETVPLPKPQQPGRIKLEPCVKPPPPQREAPVLEQHAQ